ncbi:MAG: 50S ribosomal protein L3 [Candidatus Hadarchaeum yellowstonense]|jgi:large subunit ribosomal protein L3|uniref:Large ribosomal subunit protein uL3 n=1 Tax=Hadarchaeum yellowstonense TaxID=1776334 RepID=A0A147JUD5_HADYE|nr:MAG: 50S ribosomal protein L3 [Candidatus Hadarchaeum yellowstonense]
MGRRKHHPRRGSLAYMPRVRAKRPVARVRAWPAGARLGLQGFAGYKAGMISLFMIDDRKGSMTKGQEICVPATVIEAPPMVICAVRLYQETSKGLRSVGEVWASEVPKDLYRRITRPKKYDAQKALEQAESLIKSGKVSEIRVLACTQPRAASVPKKKPDLVEIRVEGSSVEERWNYSKGILGKQIRPADVFKEGDFVDVLAITKGKGFQGPVKRWGVKILPRKSDEGRRQVGTLGPWSPPRILWTVPAAGQMGYHQRTDFNKRILKIGNDGKEVTPSGGFLRYGPVKGDFIVLAGSVPGPTKRLVQLRHPVRLQQMTTTAPSITYISTASQQGA